MEALAALQDAYGSSNESGDEGGSNGAGDYGSSAIDTSMSADTDLAARSEASPARSQSPLFESDSESDIVFHPSAFCPQVRGQSTQQPSWLAHAAAVQAHASSFDHGPVVRELRSGRYSKLEGSFYGDEQLGDLTLHTKFEAAPGASAGYKTLEVGMAFDPDPDNGLEPACSWLVRIVGGKVKASAGGKLQWKYVALLMFEPGPEFEKEFLYVPLRKLTPATDVFRSTFEENRFFQMTEGLLEWTPQAINTMSKEASALTPRVPRNKEGAGRKGQHSGRTQQQPRRKRGRKTQSEAEESFSDGESDRSTPWSAADSGDSAAPSTPPSSDEDSD